MVMYQKGLLISVSLRDSNFHTIVRSCPLTTYTNQYQTIYDTVQSIIENNFEPIGYRFMAITMGSLQNADKIIDQVNLFEAPVQNSQTIINQLNESFHSNVFFKASDLLKKESK